MATLIADDLLLLLLDDEKGTSTSSYLDTVLGGALLLELALADAVVVRERASIWSGAKVVARPGATVEDPVLQAALATVAERERSASDLVGRLGKGAKDALADRLAQRGVLARHDDRVLGLFPRTRWLPADTAHEQELRRALTAVLVQGAEPDQRTGALAALLSSVDKAPAAVDHPGVPARDVRRRAKQVAEGAWAAKAVKDAIAASTAAIMAGVTAATITTTTTSG
ncbi:GOLPH3/VPS74 family protein [Cellulomonas endometrii]|uniref:GOLPH3/VPS74 family protein n=1 Tax=Cellulomonas endometrii TaxID=3036301 RepID=UPI0024AD2B5C|nr:GPP34 family phosphoprotein [Cellulomonas endometrii]